MFHHSFGLLILNITAVRFVWRQQARMPTLPVVLPRLQQMAAQANTVGPYVLLLL